MGLFYKRELPQTEVPYTVSIGAQKTKLIIGLGNPGAKYDGTRHNIGFACLDAFVAAENASWSEKKPLKSLVCTLQIGQTRVVLCKPTTYMNNSGEAARAVQGFFKLTNADTVVVHDELDIPFGTIRSRSGGNSAGHNGIKSLIQHLGDDFGRVRIGIGPKTPEQIDSADFVLQQFNKEEQGNLKALTTEVVSLLNEYAVSEDPIPAETRSFIG